MGLGLIVAATVALGVGRRRKVPSAEMLALFGLCVVVGAASSRVFWLLFSPEVELSTALRHWDQLVDPRLGGYSSFGALGGAAGVVGIWWDQQRVQPWAGLALDALVLGGLAGLAFARLGCLANGCDFGAPSHLPWAIEYPAGSHAYVEHVQRGLIAAGAAASAPVHPFPLYMVLGTLMVVAVGVWALWNRRFAPGLVAVGAAGAYLLWRFAMEWTRDPATVVGWGNGLNIHHLFAVAGVGVLLIVGHKLRACRSAAAESQSGREKSRSI